MAKRSHAEHEERLVEIFDREVVRPYLRDNGIEPERSGIEWAIRIRTIEALLPGLRHEASVRMRDRFQHA